MKTVLITGASRGIGRACRPRLRAGGLCRRGLLAQKRGRGPLAFGRALRPRLRRGCSTSADVRRPRRRRGDGRTPPKNASGTSIALVNNAGIAQQKLFTDLTASRVGADAFAVNAGGVFHTCQLRPARHAPPPQRPDRQPLLHLGDLRRAPARCTTPPPRPPSSASPGRWRKEVGPSGRHRQLRGPRRHRHRDERQSLPRDPRRAVR